MNRFPKSSLTTIVLAVVFGYVIFEAYGKPMQAKLFPMIIGVVGLTLVLITLASELRKAFAAEGEGASGSGKVDDARRAGDFTITELEKTREGRLRALEQFGWLAGLLIGLWLLGFYITLPLMMGLYLLRHSEKPVLVAAMTVGTAIMVWGVFNKLLNLPFPEGQLLVWLNL